jgi:hypothetical protein
LVDTARIMITGSAGGLGQMAARLLIGGGRVKPTPPCGISPCRMG